MYIVETKLVSMIIILKQIYRNIRVLKFTMVTFKIKNISKLKEKKCIKDKYIVNIFNSCFNNNHRCIKHY